MRLNHTFLSLCATALALCLVGCSGAPASSAPSSSSASSAPAASSGAAQDYVQILHDARPDEFNEYYAILSPDKKASGLYASSYGNSADMEPDAIASQAEMQLSMLNITAEDADDFAISLSLMNTKAYAIAIVKPAEGKTETVQSGLTAYLEGQRANMKTYLPDQYEIAAAGEVTTLPSGEVVLVCCEGSSDVLSNIKTALA